MSLRATHELQYHEQASFVTLTYRNENLPTNDGIWPSLQPADVQMFLKRLRTSLNRYAKKYLNKPQGWPPLKVIYCGEYGDRLSRPHYHLIIFGVDFRDSHVYKIARTLFVNQIQPYTKPGLYTSTYLDNLWGHGQCVIGPVTPETVSYVCRYTLKKQQNTKNLTDTQYPEFIRYSNRGGGIGSKFIQDPKNLDTLIHVDQFVIRGQKYHPPRYYSEYLKSQNPEAHQQLVANRLTKMKKQPLKNITTLKILNRAKSQSSDNTRKL